MTERELLNHIEHGNGIFDVEIASQLELVEDKLNGMLDRGFLERLNRGGSPILRRTSGRGPDCRLVRLDVIYGLAPAGKQRLADLSG